MQKFEYEFDIVKEEEEGQQNKKGNHFSMAMVKITCI